MTNVVITGAKGRMGQSLITCASRFPNELKITGGVDQGDDLSSVIGLCDVVIDFSFHEATVSVAELCLAHKKALVIGTTGHSESEKKQLIEISKKLPVV